MHTQRLHRPLNVNDGCNSLWIRNAVPSKTVSTIRREIVTTNDRERTNDLGTVRNCNCVNFHSSSAHDTTHTQDRGDCHREISCNCGITNDLATTSCPEEPHDLHFHGTICDHLVRICGTDATHVSNLEPRATCGSEGRLTEVDTCPERLQTHRHSLRRRNQPPVHQIHPGSRTLVLPSRAKVSWLL